MNYIVFAVALAILVLSAWRGYHAGIVKMILYIVSLVLTIMLAGALLRPVSLLIKNNTSLYRNIERSVEQAVNEYDIVNIDSLKELPFPEYMTKNITSGTSENLKNIVASVVSDQIFNAIIYICLNIIIYIVIKIIIGTFNIVTKLPVIKEINRLAGLVAGLMEGILLLWLFCLVLQAFGSENWAQEIFAQINNSSFLSWIYNHNMVEKFFHRII